MINEIFPFPLALCLVHLRSLLYSTVELTDAHNTALISCSGSATAQTSLILYIMSDFLGSCDCRFHLHQAATETQKEIISKQQNKLVLLKHIKLYYITRLKYSS